MEIANGHARVSTAPALPQRTRRHRNPARVHTPLTRSHLRSIARALEGKL